MKNIKFIFVALVAIFVTLGSTSVYAQEDGNRDANGYVVKGPYLTNGGGANWFVGVGGGVNSFYNNREIGNFGWTANAYVGKWFTPSIGARLGYSYGTNSVKTNSRFASPYTQQFIHGDVMWNISDAFSGYKESRFWDFIPYAQAGVLLLNNRGDKVSTDYAMGVGLLNELRVSPTVNIFIDLSAVVAREAQFVNPVTGPRVVLPQATVGVSINLSRKKNFDRFTSVAPFTELNILEEQVGKLEKRNAELVKENGLVREQLVKEQNKEPEKVVVKEEVQVLVGSTVITFPIGSAELSRVEREKVEMFANTFTGKDVVVKVLGSADSKTGTAKRNNQLAHKRADVVKDVLVKNGVPADRIVVESVLDATENVETSRSAIVTLE